MINNYNSFLKKRIIWTLYSTLEGYIQGSTEFILKLKSISKKSDVAKRILNLINEEGWVNDDDIKQNYFDVTDNEDKVSFIQQSKVDDLDWNSEEDASLPYSIKGRGEVKIGKIAKYIMKVLDEEVSDKEIENFVNLWKASKVKTDIEFKLVNDKDISKYYNCEKYYSETGSLGSSCMREESKKFFDIYSKNKDKVQLLIYIDSKGYIHGRSLVWKLDKSPCDAEYFMDRIYSNRDSDEIRFKNFAEEKGFLYKKRMNSHLEDNIEFKWNGSDVVGEISVELKGNFDEYPFIDTLCFLSNDKKSLSNIPTKDCYHLQSVMGDCEQCDSCDGKGTSCWSCDSTGKLECDDCDSDKEECDKCEDGWIKCEDCQPCDSCFESYRKMKSSYPEFNWRERFELPT